MLAYVLYLLVDKRDGIHAALIMHSSWALLSPFQASARALPVVAFRRCTPRKCVNDCDSSSISKWLSLHTTIIL